MLGVSAVLLLCAAPVALSQTNEINRQNRTVEVTVTQSLSVPAEVAEVTIACLTHGQTHDQAYKENLRIAAGVVKALLAAGVQKEDIASGTIELREDNSDDKQKASVNAKLARLFSAEQTWKVRVAANEAQRVVDVAVHAGANGVEDVSWDVREPEKLEARARVAALEKARVTAAELASGLGGKLGEPLYASNVLSGMMALLSRGNLETSNTSVGGSSEPTFSLQLFPEKVQKSAVVRVVFALD
jgi:uncharacterized protein YggE